MSFEDKYRLVSLVEDLGVKTFIAREVLRDQKLTVFLFVGDAARQEEELLEQLRSVDRAKFPELIDVGNNQGTIFVVTQPLSGFAELKARASHLKASPAAPPPAPPSGKPGEFSKVGVWHVPPIIPEAPASPKPSAAPASAVAPVPSGFTVMFQTPAAPLGEPEIASPKAPEPVTLPPIPVAPPPPVAKSAPGEFTGMFQTPAAPLGEPAIISPQTSEPATPPATSVAPPPPPPKAAPGEFTAMFQTPVAPLGEPAVSIPQKPAVAPPPTASVAPPPPAPKSAPGEFTGMFQTPAAPLGESPLNIAKEPKPTQAAPQTSGPGEFTRMFQSPLPASYEPAPLPKKPEAQGQFTRIFGGSGRPETPIQTGTGLFESAPTGPQQVKQDARASSSPPPAFHAPASEFTRIFGGSPDGTPMPSGSASMPAAAPAPPAAHAPGEYTRMFSAQSMLSGPAAEPSPLQTPQPPQAAPESSIPAKQNSKLPFVLTGIILLLIVVIIVLLFAVRK